MKYVNDGEVGWTPPVRRRRKESESRWDLNVNDKRRSLVRYRKVDMIPGEFISKESFEMGGKETQP